MTLLGHDRYCDEIVTQTNLLAELLPGADLSAVVPTCPDWSLADLVRHVGGNLRSVEAAVRTGASIDDPAEAAQIPGVTGPADVDRGDPAALGTWLDQSAEKFAGTLRDAGPHTDTQVWTVQANTGFWVRRAAHDAVIHRADAAGTVGAGYTLAPELATDAIDELLELFSEPEAVASSPRLAELRGPGKSIHLHATDVAPERAGGVPELAAEWLIEFDADGFSWRHDHQKATVALRGPLTDVLLVFYRRLPADSDRVAVLGDAALLEFWLERVTLD